LVCLQVPRHCAEGHPSSTLVLEPPEHHSSTLVLEPPEHLAL
jgi:hypothetical protein